MARVSAFRSDDARAAYFDLYDAALVASPMQVTETDVETSFGRTHVLAAGDASKPPLVAIHPLAFSSTSWLPLLPTFAANHSVTMIDAVGDLNKSVASKPMTRANHVVAWLDETLSVLEIERAAMVGMSMGSWMATQYAMAFPDRVERLALIAPVGLVSNQHLGWILSGYYANYLRPTGARLETFIGATATPAGRERLLQDPWRPVIEQYVTGTIGFHKPMLSLLRAARCDLQRLASAPFPVLVMVGTKESLHDGPKMADRLRRRLPQARIELIDEANHLIPIDQPQVVERLLADFLS
jgi:pimeloyl-ACP methyl ester carboxylesterase